MNHQRQPSQKHDVIARASANHGKPYLYPWDDDDDDQEYDDVWPPPMPRSAIRYQGQGTPVTTTGQPPAIYSRNGKRKFTPHAVPPARPPRQPRPNVNTATPPDVIYGQPARQRDTQAHQPRPKRVHWLLPVGLVTVTMIAGFIVVSFLVNWLSAYQDDLHYGRPRTYQTDMVVGHGDSRAHPSHFIAINLNRHVEVIEFQGGDPAKAKVYQVAALYGEGEDLAPVTLTFQDVNGDGLLDMIVNVANNHFVYINDQGQFRPARPGETLSM